MPKSDEILIRLRDEMSHDEIHEAVNKVNDALHRLVQIAIDAKCKCNHPVTINLMTAAGATQTTADFFESVKHNQQNQFALPGQMPGRRPQ